jgi:hypothetical protein
MPQSRTRTRLSQPTLFHPPQPRPPFQGLPQDIQDKTIRLLARLLRLRADRLLVAGETPEARHE